MCIPERAGRAFRGGGGGGVGVGVGYRGVLVQSPDGLHSQGVTNTLRVTGGNNKVS